jgi:hypothetical protein
MKPATGLVAVVVFSAACSVYATYIAYDGRAYDQGAWPESWPKELEPLRTQSRTIESGLLELPTHVISFTNRRGFESAWPHVLKVKGKGAPLVLLRGPVNHWHFGKIRAGVLIQSPPRGTADAVDREAPIPGATDLRMRWMWTNYIELVVDGKLVDLNRIPLPADTPIIDERFTQPREKTAEP